MITYKKIDSDFVEITETRDQPIITTVSTAGLFNRQKQLLSETDFIDSKFRVVDPADLIDLLVKDWYIRSKDSINKELDIINQHLSGITQTISEDKMSIKS